MNSLIDPRIKEYDCSNRWEKNSHHCANVSYHIQCIDYYQSYSPVAHEDSIRINISIVAMHRFTASILDVSNAFHNTNVPIHERVFVSPPPYYLDYFEISHPNVPLNRYYGPFFLQFLNGIQVTKPAGR